MKRMLSIIIIIILSTILGLAYNASTNLSLRLLEATDDVNPLRVDLNYNFELVDAIFDAVSLTEFSYLDGVTSAIQTQLDAVGSGAVDTSGTPVDNDIAVFTDLNTIEGLDYSELKVVLNLEIGIDIQAYDATLTDIADGTINENLVNTANPWADNEVDDDITIDLATAAEHLLIDAKEENTSAIVIGQPVYQSGATGMAFPKVGLADADVGTKAHVLGLAASAFVMNETGTVMISGILTGVDSVGATAINPSDQTWSAGEKLYLHTTPGGLTNVEPTVGRVVEIGYILYGESNNDAIVIHIQVTHPHIEVSTGEDIVLRLGDSGGTNKVIIKDYTNTEVAHIDSDGGADFNSLILDTVLAIAEGGTNSGTSLNGSKVMVSSATAVIESANITTTELELLNGLGNTIVTDNNAVTDLEGLGLTIDTGTLKVDYADISDEIAGDIAEGELADSIIVSADIKDGVITEADLKVVDSPNDEEIFTFEDTTGDFEWHTKAELGIGTATSITDNLIIEIDLNADEDPIDNDILTFDTTGDNFSWQTPAELSLGDMNDLVDDTDPDLGGELDAGAYSIVFTEQVLTSGTAIAWDLGDSNKAILTAAHDFTITITAPSGAMNAQLIVTQDGTGTRVMDEIITQADATIATSDVHTDTEIIDITIDIPTGARIRFDNDVGTDVPEPLVEDTIYYAINVDSTHIKVATTKANAIAGTNINLTDTGTNVHTVEQLVKWTGGTLGVLTTDAGTEDILSLTYKTADLQWYAILSNDFY